MRHIKYVYQDQKVTLKELRYENEYSNGDD